MADPTLSPEDALRLNVLLAGEVEAVRLDDGAMTLHALTPRGEAVVKLSPQGNRDAYLKQVREFLAGHVLGSPGGYPVYLQRWTRMGQAREQGLDKLLLLGEPEAVVSVAYSPGLTDELARRAWWAMPVADNARRMLERENVVRGAMGPVLARFLVEHLPFETEPHVRMDTVRIVLAPGLLDEATRLRLWNKGRSDNAFYVGFLERTPDDLPAPEPPRADREAARAALDGLAAAGDPYALLLLRVLGGQGQTFLEAARTVLARPADQDVANAALDALGAYFAAARPAAPCAAPAEARQAAEADPAAVAARTAAPTFAAELLAIGVLAQVSREWAVPVFRTTTAIGTLMRRKLEPVVTPLLDHLATLRGRRP